MLIVCEGKETEPLYFNGFRRKYNLQKELFTIVGFGADPVSVIKEAIKRKTEEQDYDSAWAVFDCDEHQGVKNAFQMAKDHEIKIAFSNPCFELWFLLHFQDQEAFIERDAVSKRLKKFVTDYEKTTKDMYNKLQGSQKKAFKRTDRLREIHKSALKPETENPSTTVDQLVLSLYRHYKIRLG